MPEPQSIRVLIVDDDPHFLDALEALLKRADGMEVVGRAADGDEALRRTAELTPDVITMDVVMPIVNGIDATRMISAYFKVPIVLVTGSESGADIGEGLAAGAVAHVLKTNAWDDLIPTIRAAVRQSPQ